MAPGEERERGDCERRRPPIRARRLLPWAPKALGKPRTDALGPRFVGTHHASEQVWAEDDLFFDGPGVPEIRKDRTPVRQLVPPEMRPRDTSNYKVLSQQEVRRRQRHAGRDGSPVSPPGLGCSWRTCSRSSSQGGCPMPSCWDCCSSRSSSWWGCWTRPRAR